MCLTSRPPFSELLLLDQLHGVPTVVGDRGGFEPPAVTQAVDPETDLGARYHPLLFHAAVANHRFHVLSRPIRVAQVVGEPEFNTRSGHHPVGRIGDTGFRLQRRLSRPGTAVVDIRRRQTLGRTGRFVAGHRRIRAKGERTEKQSKRESEEFGHGDLLC